MSDYSEPNVSTSIPPAPNSSLRRGAVNTRHLVFFVLACAAPLTILVGFAPLGLVLAGQGLPAGYIIPGVVYLVFTGGFAAMSRHTRRPGAFYAYIADGLGDVAGAGAGVVAYIGYLGGQIGFVVATGIFASSALKSIAGVSLSVYGCALGVALLVGVIGYGRVDLGAKVLAVMMTLELGVLAVFCAAVLAHGGHEGLSFGAFSPSNFMTEGLASVLVLTFGAYVGFEQTAIYSEEVVDSRRTVARATYAAVLVLAAVYAFCTWVIVQAVGPSRMGDFLSGDPSALVFNLNSEFAGTLMTDVMHLLIVTSFFAGCVALQNACSRYLLAMGRARIFPSVLAKVSPTVGSPSVASVAQTVLVFLAVGAFALTPADPYTEVVLWTNTPTIIAVVALQILTCIAIVAFFRRDRRGEGVWQRVLSPTLAGIALTIALVYLVTNMGRLLGLSTAGNVGVTAPLVAAFIFGIGRGWQLTRRTTGREPDSRGFELSTSNEHD